LHENSRNLAGKIPQQLDHSPNDDHPSASSSTRPVRKRDDNGLPPTKLLAPVHDDKIPHHVALTPNPLLRRLPLPQLHASRQQTPDVHDRKPRPCPMLLLCALRGYSDTGLRTGLNPLRPQEYNDIPQTPLQTLPGGEYKHHYPVSSFGFITVFPLFHFVLFWNTAADAVLK
jgi:hypothetical protein